MDTCIVTINNKLKIVKQLAVAIHQPWYEVDWNTLTNIVNVENIVDDTEADLYPVEWRYNALKIHLYSIKFGWNKFHVEGSPLMHDLANRSLFYIPPHYNADGITGMDIACSMSLQEWLSIYKLVVSPYETTNNLLTLIAFGR